MPALAGAEAPAAVETAPKEGEAGACLSCQMLCKLTGFPAAPAAAEEAAPAATEEKKEKDAKKVSVLYLIGSSQLTYSPER